MLNKEPVKFADYEEIKSLQDFILLSPEELLAILKDCLDEAEAKKVYEKILFSQNLKQEGHDGNQLAGLASGHQLSVE
jgi:hypothetical protein